MSGRKVFQEYLKRLEFILCSANYKFGKEDGNKEAAHKRIGRNESG